MFPKRFTQYYPAGLVHSVVKFPWEKIEVENTAYTEDINKTLRAIYTGHEIEIKFITKDRNYYTLEVGKKNNS